MVLGSVFCSDLARKDIEDAEGAGNSLHCSGLYLVEDCNVGVMAKFEIRALGIIVPFAAAFLIGFLCICRHKFFLWRLKGNSDSEQASAAGGPASKPEAAKHKKTVSIDVDKYEAPSDCEAGNRGAESESDSILMADPEKSRKSICG